MIIGVDAGALSITDERLKVGVYRVTVNLLRQLGSLDRKNEYRLYSFLPLDRKLMDSFGPRMKNLVLRPKIGWFRLSLPLELRRRQPDLFLGLAQAIPFGAPKSIGFVYDLGFLHHPEVYPDSAKRLIRQTDELVQRSAKIIAISKSTKTDLLNRYHLPDSKVVIIYPGVDGRFTAKAGKFVGKNPYFLFVGALKRGKNISFAIKAFNKFIKTTKQPYDFYIVGGDYWRDPEIDKTIKSNHLEDRVKLLGYIDDNKLPMYYRGAVGLVAPSLWEGFCLPAVEAMAIGCPVIATNVGSLPEIIGKAGVIVNHKNIGELTKALKDVSENTQKRDSMIRFGLVAVKKFSWNLFGEKVLEMINSLNYGSESGITT